MTPLLCPRSLVPTVVLTSMIVMTGCSPRLASKPEKVKAVPVKTVAVMEEDIQRSTTQPATVHAFYRAEIRAKVSGYVSDVKADIGDVVEAGATLAMIDIPEMRKQREILEARITRHESEEARSQAGVALAERRPLKSISLCQALRAEAAAMAAAPLPRNPPPPSA